ncbi:uncharacterized protein DUF3237 [Pseudomonas duriflava]|uniref:UPF0311 protein IQ22_01955 n=1 Tax=Pseudomonas duriflava TaxID=459528 RepID=A0A562QEC2_9PSED|nr:DUF3237 domain-containing protein [Pseudomonas duriflava]TWI55043.1 uncharacterized protein DUF3237 [Pseudomonas duriflava]
MIRRQKHHRFALLGLLNAVLMASLHAVAQAATEEAPKTELVYEATVEIAETLSLGKGPLGERRMVPITGGRFNGAGLRGKVLPGGADRQLIRADGVRQLDALYEMRTTDGVILTVRNRVLIHELDAERYAFSHVDITAPSGKYEWLNRYVYVGTLTSLKPQRNAVLIKVYRLK